MCSDVKLISFKRFWPLLSYQCRNSVDYIFVCLHKNMTTKESMHRCQLTRGRGYNLGYLYFLIKGHFNIVLISPSFKGQYINIQSFIFTSLKKCLLASIFYRGVCFCESFCLSFCLSQTTVNNRLC